MHYFITGATGFIGKRLVKKLLERKGTTVYFLLRAESAAKVADLHAYWGLTTAKAQTRAVAIHGDLTLPGLGVSATDVKLLKGKVDHFHHLAAVTTWEPTKTARSL
jgi:thioester reductase-like protein